jgi:predicted Zn-dependent protease
MTMRAAVLALLALSACAISDEEELQLGQQTAAEIGSKMPMITDPIVHRYINELGSSIAGPADRRGLEWRFHVVDSRAINAFAVPGGYIYVNRGLIERAETLDELAGVLGHEVAHVTLRHSVEQMEKAQKTNVGVAVVCTLTSVCESGLAQVAIGAGSQAWFARHSRGDELEADAEGVRYVSNAGIDPGGVPRFFERLLEERQRRPAMVEGWFGTHPLEEDRIANARRLIDELGLDARRDFRRDTPAYQAFRQRLMGLPASPELPASR